MASKRYVAKRGMRKVLEGYIHGGEAVPASSVSPAEIDAGHMGEGIGRLPVDVRTHAAFTLPELAELVAEAQWALDKEFTPIAEGVTPLEQAAELAARLSETPAP